MDAPEADTTPLCEASIQDILDELQRRFVCGVIAMTDGKMPDKPCYHTRWGMIPHRYGLAAFLMRAGQTEFEEWADAPDDYKED